MIKQKIVAGTAQLGFKYFHKEKITKKRSIKILKSIVKNKINILDTANSYGKSESYIGDFSKINKHKFIICSKLKKSFSKNPLRLRKNIKESILSSLNKLKVKKIDFFFIHNDTDLNKLVSKELLKFKLKKYLKNIGASIYTINNYKKCLELNFDILQIPFNFIDHRFLRVIKNDTKHVFFARSILLRGNIKKDNISLPSKKKFLKLIENLSKFKKKHGFKNFLDLNFSFIKSFRKINYVIIGFNKANQAKVVKEFEKSRPMNKIQIKELVEIVKNSKIENSIDLRFW